MKKSLVAAAVGATFALGWTGHIEGTAVVLLPPETYNIVTVVGGGTDTGDGRLAVAAHLDVPSGVAFDSIGNMYVAETSTYMTPPSPLHHRVRKVDKATGIITTVAGTGEPGPYTGDNQFATLANITAPIRVVFDHADNFYINGGTGNNRIQKVDAATGLITDCRRPPQRRAVRRTSAMRRWRHGHGRLGDRGSSGLDIRCSRKLLLQRQQSRPEDHRSRHRRCRPTARRHRDGDGICGNRAAKTHTSDNIDATLAKLNSPRSLAIDPSGENLYIADLFNNRVRKVNLTTRIITTAVGMTGEACSPNTDPCGDEQPVEVAKITSPTNVSFDSHGNLYVNSQTRIRKVDTSGIITTVAGTGVPGFSGDGGPALRRP